MNIERLNRIEEIHYAALQLPVSERESFLSESCGTDADLRHEVESLLAFEDNHGSFLDTPPEALAAEMLAEPQGDPALIGTEISHYKVVKLLGTGGMGEVYLAEDTRLRRKVALKLLPPQFSADDERKKRFEKEARAVSALNHPNIITIYAIGEAGNISFMATEFIDGHTLRHLMAEKRFGWLETVRIALQVAGALDSAHLVGIIHRDIKPANIMVRGDGIVKVLDFGLAKLTVPESGDLETREHTAPHRVMGTINYMSPEQALGERIDARTDIFSFGVVLYEMLTGEVPFAGSSDAAIYNATINKTLPSVCGSDDHIPPALDYIVGHALEKDRDKRYQTFADLRADLKNLLRDSQTDSFDHSFTNGTFRHTDPDKDMPWPMSNGGIEAASEPVATKRAGYGRVPMFVVALLLAAFASFAVWRYMPAISRQAGPPTATAKIVPFKTFAGAADQPAFSPNGNQIAFVWDGGGGKNLDIYVKLIGAGSPLRLTNNPAEDIGPAWSPDGRYLAFIRRTEFENGIFIVPALGGAERKLGRTEPTLSTQAWPECRLSWSPDGKSLAVADRGSAQERFGIYSVSIEDGEKQRLTSPPESAADMAPAFSPDGQTLAFVRNASLNNGDIYLTNVDGGAPRRLTTDGQRIHSLAWTADGSEIVFSSNRGGGFGLWRISISGGQAEAVAGTGQNAYSPAISPRGDQLVYNASFVDSDIWRVGGLAAGGRRSPPTKLIFSTRQEHSPQYSPDGKRIAFVSDRSGSEEIWLCEADGSSPAQLTFFNGPSVGSPRWSPDSQQIVFDARPNGNADIYIISAAGGKPRPFIAEPSHDVMASWSADGNWIYFCSNRSGDFQIWKESAAGGEAVQVTKQGGFEAFESPKGDLLYYSKERSPGAIWQVPVAGGEERQVSELLSIGYWRYWAVAVNGIYFASPAVPDGASAISFYNFTTHRVSRVSTFEREPFLGLPGLTVSPDGRSILFAQPGQSNSDIMLIENFR